PRCTIPKSGSKAFPQFPPAPEPCGHIKPADANSRLPRETHSPRAILLPCSAVRFPASRSATPCAESRRLARCSSAKFAPSPRTPLCALYTPARAPLPIAPREFPKRHSSCKFHPRDPSAWRLPPPARPTPPAAARRNSDNSHAPLLPPLESPNCPSSQPPQAACPPQSCRLQPRPLHLWKETRRATCARTPAASQRAELFLSQSPASLPIQQTLPSDRIRAHPKFFRPDAPASRPR